jgi:hypothetical protein
LDITGGCLSKRYWRFAAASILLTCFVKMYLDAVFLPPSGVQISIRSCLMVNASRRNSFAKVSDSVTEDNVAPFFPNCLMTELVL